MVPSVCHRAVVQEAEVADEVAEGEAVAAVPGRRVLVLIHGNALTRSTISNR